MCTIAELAEIGWRELPPSQARHRETLSALQPSGEYLLICVPRRRGRVIPILRRLRKSTFYLIRNNFGVQAITDINKNSGAKLVTVSFFNAFSFSQRATIICVIIVILHRRTNFRLKRNNFNRRSPQHGLKNGFNRRVCWCRIADGAVAGVRSCPHSGVASDFQLNDICYSFHLLVVHTGRSLRSSNNPDQNSPLTLSTPASGILQHPSFRTPASIGTINGGNGALQYSVVCLTPVPFFDHSFSMVKYLLPLTHSSCMSIRMKSANQKEIPHQKHT